MRTTKITALILALALIFSLTACGSDKSGDEKTDKNGNFNYSHIFDDNGYFKDIKALDYVTLEDYDKIAVSTADIDSEVEYFRANNIQRVEVYDRPVRDGDTLNIDYVGSVDGKELEKGTTNGAGTEVIIGTTFYIEDFLKNLIGHMPGETLDIEVTFPENYGVEDLNGKDAVFVTTINYIIEEVEPEVNDDFVVKYLSEDYHWNTVEEMRNGIAGAIGADNLYQSSVIAERIPESIIEYELDTMVEYYKQVANAYGVDFVEFIQGYLGVESEEAMREKGRDYCDQQCRYYLFLQAIAEDQGIVPTEDDVKTYVVEQAGDDSYYDSYIDAYGMNYAKSLALYNMMDDYIASKVVVE